MKKINGAILLVILIFLQIFSLFSLLELTAVASLFKYNREHWQNSKNQYQALTMLTKVENYTSEHIDDCIIPITPVQELRQLPTTWWQENGCYGKYSQFSYYYVLELLGDDPCSVIKMLNKELAAIFYRISLVLIFPDANKIFLQSTIAIPHDFTADCKNQSHVISSGRQMLRFIY